MSDIDFKYQKSAKSTHPVFRIQLVVTVLGKCSCFRSVRGRVLGIQKECRGPPRSALGVGRVLWGEAALSLFHENVLKHLHLSGNT